MVAKGEGGVGDGGGDVGWVAVVAWCCGSILS